MFGYEIYGLAERAAWKRANKKKPRNAAEGQLIFFDNASIQNSSGASMPIKPIFTKKRRPSLTQPPQHLFNVLLCQPTNIFAPSAATSLRSITGCRTAR